MINTIFYYLSAKNFICFGPEVEIDLTKLGNIVLVRGNNLDVQDEEERVASNGVGKSTIPEIIVYTLFGKTIKHPKKLSHRDVINNQVGKDLRTEVRWGDFRVVRTRKPDSLRFWESKDKIWDDSTEITLGGMPATQKLIEEKIGLNYESFVNIVVFTDNNAGCFLECDGPTKRQIVENLLSLDMYREHADVAKTLRKKLNEKIKELLREHENLTNQLESNKKRLQEINSQKKQWKDNKKLEISQINKKIESKLQELEKTDEGNKLAQYEQAQEKINEINGLISDLEAKKNKLEDNIQKANKTLDSNRTKRQEIQSTISSNEASIRSFGEEIEKSEKRIKSLTSKEGTVCDVCCGVVSKENYGIFIEKSNNDIEEYRVKIASHNEIVDNNKNKLIEVNKSIKKYEEAIAQGKVNNRNMQTEATNYRNELTKLTKIERPTSISVINAVLQKDLQNLWQQLFDATTQLKGNSPYDIILASSNKEIKNKTEECQTKKEEINRLEADIPYYDFWVTAFGDAGIRKFVIDGIIPALNSRIHHWMQFLIDGKISLEFDNEFEELIQRNPPDGDPFIYPQMSRGEQRRLNLAVAQAFAHVRMLDTGRMISLIFLDEVTTNIDPVGVVGIYNMILELSKERQVFVTTHDQGLLDMLEGCETLILEKKQGFTRLVKDD